MGNLTGYLDDIEERGDLIALQSLFALANQFDDRIYDLVMEHMTPEQMQLIHNSNVPSHLKRSILAFRGPYLDPLDLNTKAFPSER